MLSYFFPIVGAAVAIAGGDKLDGSGGYERMFQHLGWSPASKQSAALAEVVGGLLMMPRLTRRIGGVVLAATSAAVLASEINRGETKLAVPRSVVLLLALTAASKRLSLPG